MPASDATRREVTAAYPSRSISCSTASSRSARVFEFAAPSRLDAVTPAACQQSRSRTKHLFGNAERSLSIRRSGERLVSRVAVVTGAASGIGLGVARRFGSDGDRVALLDRQGDAAEQAAAELRDAGCDGRRLRGRRRRLAGRERGVRSRACRPRAGRRARHLGRHRVVRCRGRHHSRHVGAGSSPSTSPAPSPASRRHSPT